LINIIVPNHLNTLTQIINNSNHIIPVVILPSLIGAQDLSYQSSIAVFIDFHAFNSSRILSYIITFASTAIPSERTIAAIPLNDDTTPNNLIHHNKYIKNAINQSNATVAFFQP
jgi:hypothetical protein